MHMTLWAIRSEHAAYNGRYASKQFFVHSIHISFLLVFFSCPYDERLEQHRACVPMCDMMIADSITQRQAMRIQQKGKHHENGRHAASGRQAR